MKTDKYLIVKAGGYGRSYGGGQVYVGNILSQFIGKGGNVSLLSADSSNNIRVEKGKINVNGVYVDQWFINTTSVHESDNTIINELLYKISPDVVHAHSLKSAIAKACVELSIPCIITAHHGGILCPAGALLNHKDEICTVKASHDNCLPCVMRNIRAGSTMYPFFRMIPRQQYMKIGSLLRKLPFIHFVTPFGIAASSIERKIQEWETISRYATLLIAPSVAIKNAMVRNGTDEKKIIVLPHGIPRNGQVPLKPGIHNRPVRFFYFGRINYNKGLHILLEAFSKLNGSAELHIMGDAVTKQENRYRKRLQSRYGANNIFWHGNVPYEQISGRIAQYDVMVHPTICLEIFGLTIAESLDIGRPIIATRCGGPEMQIKDGKNGLLVKPNDVQDLKNAMQYVIDNRDDICNFIRNSNDVISIEEHTQQLINIYESVAKKAVVDRC